MIIIKCIQLINKNNMKTLFDFLNSQSGDRLVGYGIVFLISVYYIMQCLVYIAQAMFSKRK